jgi:hypothetical protein
MEHIIAIVHSLNTGEFVAIFWGYVKEPGFGQRKKRFSPRVRLRFLAIAVAYP